MRAPYRQNKNFSPSSGDRNTRTDLPGILALREWTQIASPTTTQQLQAPSKACRRWRPGVPKTTRKEPGWMAVSVSGTSVEPCMKLLPVTNTSDVRIAGSGRKPAFAQQAAFPLKVHPPGLLPWEYKPNAAKGLLQERVQQCFAGPSSKNGPSSALLPRCRWLFWRRLGGQHGGDASYDFWQSTLRTAELRDTLEVQNDLPILLCTKSAA